MLSLSLAYLMGFFVGFMDCLRWRYNFFPKWIAWLIRNRYFWHPDLAWKNKYKERGDSWIKNLIEKLDNGPLAAFTDGWHVVKLLMIFSAVLMALTYSGDLISFFNDTLNFLFTGVLYLVVYAAGFYTLWYPASQNKKRHDERFSPRAIS